MPKLTIIRGLPGSGKSTMAKWIAQTTGAAHFEADDYFMINGEYKFDPTRIKHAHEHCQRMTNEAMNKGRDVVIANTFTQHWEMKPYLEMARGRATVEIIVARGNYQNVHGVPQEVIERMRERWQD